MEKPKITVGRIRELLNKYNLIGFSKPKIKSSNWFVWPLRLFLVETYPYERFCQSDWTDYEESDYAHAIHDKFSRSYCDGFNLGFDGFSKEAAIAGVSDHLKPKVLHGYHDGKRIKRFI